MKEGIKNAQAIYFVDESLPEWELVLQTDASNKGISAVLLQRYTNSDGSR